MRISRFFSVVGVAAVLAVIAGCHKSSSGSKFVPVDVIINSGTAGSQNFQWESEPVSGATSNKYIFFLNRNTIQNQVRLNDAGVKVVLLARDPSNTGNTLAQVDGVKQTDNDFFRFELTRSNGDLLLEFAVQDGSVTIERVVVGLTADPYTVIGPNGVDFFLGVTLVNGVVYKIGAKKVPGLSGQDWPGEDGDKFFRFTDKGNGKYDILVRINTQSLGSSTLALLNTWSGNFALPAALEAVTDGWFVARDQQIPDGQQDFTAIGVNFSNNSFAETGRLNIAGSEYIAQRDGKDVFQAQFDNGLVHHPSVNLTTPSAVRLAPPFLRLGLNVNHQFILLADYTAGGANFTYDVTKRQTSGWTSSNQAVATINAATGLLSTVAVGVTDVQVGPFNGKTSNTVQVTVVQKQIKAIQISAPQTSVQVGGQIASAAIGIFDDNSTQNVTTQVQWQSSNTGAFTIGANTGVGTGVAAGSAVITAQSGGILSNAIVVTVTQAPPSFSIQLSSPSSAPIASAATLQLQATLSDGQQRTLTFISSDNTVATVNTSGLVTAANTLNGGIVNFTAQAADSSGTVTSNAVEVVVYGQRGAIKGRLFVLKDQADAVLNAGTGNVVINADVFGNFTTDKTTRVSGIAGINASTVQFYELDPADTAALAPGTTVRWNIARKGTPPGVFFPDSTTPAAADVENNGVGGKRFVHTAK